MLQKIVYVILGISIALVFMPKGVSEYRGSRQPEVLGTTTLGVLRINSAPELASNMPVPGLSAKSAFAFDLSSGTILYTWNFDEELPVASLTKLMTGLVTVRSISTDPIVEIKKTDINVVGSNMGLIPGEKITVLNLLRGLLISSSNDAAQVLADFVGGNQEKFVELMNNEAARMGLNSTHFDNAVGWDSDNNYSTAHDLSILAQEFMKHDLLSDIVRNRELEVASIDNKFKHKLTTTNKLLLENPMVTGIKTGFTSQAKGNLVIRAGSRGQEVVTIVLGSDNREEDSRKLLDWIFQVYRW